METVDPVLLGLFSEELKRRAQALSLGFVALEKQPKNEEALGLLMREAHALKGASRMVGASAVERLIHRAEEDLSAVKKNQKRAEELPFNGYFALCDWLETLSAIPVSEFFNQIDSSAQTVEALMAGLSIKEAAPAAIFAKQESPYSSGEKSLRVSALQMHSAVNSAAQIHVSLARFSGLSQAVAQLKAEHSAAVSNYGFLEDLLSTQTLSDQVRRVLVQVRAHLLAVSGRLRELETELGCFSEGHIEEVEHLYSDLTQMRLRPVGEIWTGFSRLIRDLEKNLHKNVILKTTGGDTLIDRDILSALEAPLMHMIRNAVDHGLEMPQERLAAGKEAAGHIAIYARHTAGLFELEVSDDGRGIDAQVIRADVIARGLVSSEVGEQLTDAQCFDFLFIPGYSTAKVVSDISGRGIGLDCVKNLARELEGSVQIHTEPGKGTRFTLRLPISRVLTTLVVFIHGGEYWAIASSHVRSIEGYTAGVAIDLQQLLTGEPAKKPSRAVLNLQVGELSFAIAVEEVVDVIPLVQESIPQPWEPLPGVSALATLPSGDIALTLDVETLAQRAAVKTAIVCEGLEVLAAQPSVLIVDDSSATVLSHAQFFRQKGCTVQTADNGVEALDWLSKEHFDAVITDVDMPDMDGMELIQKIRGAPAWESLPIVVISSRTSQSNQKKILQLGANAFFEKKALDEEKLWDNVKSFLHHQHE